jgi:hypothetical protein
MYTLDDGLEGIADMREALRTVEEDLETASTVEHLRDLDANIDAALEHLAQITRDLKFISGKVKQSIAKGG